MHWLSRHRVFAPLHDLNEDIGVREGGIFVTNHYVYIILRRTGFMCVRTCVGLLFTVWTYQSCSTAGSS
ncbi:hypothetical protein AERO9AM_10345 [Aeromicrobium sp. 9AM]|nr:hypothetical protein AERO9AM_10345 [Aeromicrobium sp. 9AM]